MRLLPRVLFLAASLALAGDADAGAGMETVPIPGGTFIMGDAAGDANEMPARVSVPAFSIMWREVTNAQFDAFVSRVGHVTDVEKTGAGYVWTDRWRLIKGAGWEKPHGPSSGIGNRASHPVVQVSARDAQAFCAFHRLRLPTEIEWEFAARGIDGRRYPWGNDAPVQGGLVSLANFGTVPCCAADDSDGYRTTAPVGSFPAGTSPFGVLDMAGNVWEWTSSPFPGQPDERVIRGGGWGNNPYCLRVSYRHGNPPDIGLDMVGFRCAGE